MYTALLESTTPCLDVKTEFLEVFLRTPLEIVIQRLDRGIHNFNLLILLDPAVKQRDDESGKTNFERRS